MTKKISSVLATATFRQSMISSGSTVVNGLLGMLFYILVARTLGPTNFGIFSISILSATLLSDIASVGTDTGIVRFVSSKSVLTPKFLKLGLKVKVLTSSILVLAGLFAVPYIAKQILFKPELELPLLLSLFGAVGLQLFSFATSALQALQRFWVWAGLNIAINGVRLTVICLLILLGLFSTFSSLAVYIAVPFFGFIVGLFFLPRFLRAKNDAEVSSKFLNYNKWVAIFLVIAAVSARLDTYITTRFLDLNSVGIYSVATGLSAIGIQLVADIATVVAPKMASFETKAQYIKYFKKLYLFVGLLSVLGIVSSALLSPIFIPLFYGQEYSQAIIPFLILAISQAIFLFSVPVHTSIFYYFSYPKLFVYISIIHFLIVGLLGWQLINLYGVLGASFTVLIGNLSNFLIPAIWVFQKNRHK